VLLEAELVKGGREVADGGHRSGRGVERGSAAGAGGYDARHGREQRVEIGNGDGDGGARRAEWTGK
jgi:hypothetical protein